MPPQLRAPAIPIPIGPPLAFTGVRPPFEKQANPKWCWTGCVRMILSHYDGASADSQCEIGQKGLKLIGKVKPKCCTPDGRFNDNIECVEFLPDPKITLLWQQYPLLVSVSHVKQRIPVETLHDELKLNHHVELGYNQSTSGHVVLVYGFTTDTLGNTVSFLLHDPIGSKDVAIVASHIVDFGKGIWNKTWIIQKA